jgi:hypothetical protein
MQRIDKRSTAFRLLCLCLITVAGIVVGCGKAIEAPRGTAVLGLSAHFVDARQRPIDDPGDPAYSKSHLKIQGQAYKDGVPIKQGAVDVTVVSNTYKFNQSMFLPLDEHGNFASPVDAFTSIHPGSEVAITADLASGDAHESHSKIDIDSESPTKKWVAVLGIPAVLLGMLAD